MNLEDRTTTAAMVEFEPLGCIQLALPVDYAFLLQWVRRISMREVIGDLGTRLRSPRPAKLRISVEGDLRLVKSIDAVGQMRLRVYKTASDKLPATIVNASVPFPAGNDDDTLLKTLFQQNTVRDTVYGLVPQCLKTQYTLLCDRIFEETGESEPLLDVSFADTEKGMESWMRAVEGDFTTLFETGSDVQSHRGTLSTQLTAGATIELYLPHLDRRDWKFPAAAVKRAEVRCNDAGQIFVGWPEQRVMEGMLRLAGFTTASKTSSIASSMVSHTGAPGEDGTTITRQIPTGYLTSWFEAPGDRETTYTAAYGEIAMSVQRLLREELPRLWFSNPSRYARLADSHAMLVYKCSRPFFGRTRTELTYEFLDHTSMRRFYRTANQAMSAELQRIQTILKGSDVARHYQPTFARDIVQEVAIRQHNLHRLMAAESTIIECFIQFGLTGHEFRYRMTSHPQHTAEGIARFAADFANALIYKAKRIHPTLDYGNLALPLLMEASSALSGVLRGESGVQRILHEQTQIDWQLAA
jgi:hypothetical protein